MQNGGERKLKQQPITEKGRAMSNTVNI